ncbi:hypothetical protein BCR33DRAFT_578108 [Rhizoclosmatium globosum]|uniref:Mannan endo-1,6-alpha-mannosidase n=1 Tax=Rhizoclosmatium globosum TaxID=329046 RepID=A0A1Y2B553_9FUNG|nr:hypothetical protein BCR33DRAFT_578108 [Rhizoclosmatium globosum]|eukprot:ORY29225.1 hypothetical protein BCR33DRAFT_578108 [Rhizoclosmatium globosum]
MHLVVPLLLLAASAAAQQTTLNLTNADAVAAATTTALWPLMQFFSSNSGNNNGAWIEQYSNGHWLIQWHESGIFHDQFYSAFRFSTASTSKYRTTTDNLVQLAVKDNGDFLEGHKPSEQVSGRWSDDIAWWALAGAYLAPLKLHSVRPTPHSPPNH